MRKAFDPRPWFYPFPVLMLGTWNEDGSPNLMNAAWGGLTASDRLSICVEKSHKTTENLLRTKALSVSFGVMEEITACDYLGMVSGNKEKKKVEKAGLTAIASERVDAPLFKELPFAFECELVSYDPETERLEVRIAGISIDESALTDGKLDLEKFHPLSFDPVNACYRSLTGPLAPAYSCGKALMDE